MICLCPEQNPVDRFPSYSTLNPSVSLFVCLQRDVFVRHLSKSERFVAGRQTVSHSVERVDRWSVARFMFSEPKMLSLQEYFQV